MVAAIQRALKNIAAHGDTDIFPFPFERYLIMDTLVQNRFLQSEIRGGALL